MTDEEIDKVLAPYDLAVGRLTRSWNRLHATLCWLFCELAGKPPIFEDEQIVQGADHRVAQAAWNSQQSDRNQRKLLKSAAESSITGRLVNEIVWLVDTVDKISQERNEAIHSPLMMRAGDPPRAMADWISSGSTLAKSLGKRDSDLLQAFRKCDSVTRALNKHAWNLAWNLAQENQRKPWSWHEIPQELQKHRRKFR